MFFLLILSFIHHTIVFQVSLFILIFGLNSMQVSWIVFENEQFKVHS